MSHGVAVGLGILLIIGACVLGVLALFCCFAMSAKGDGSRDRQCRAWVDPETDAEVAGDAHLTPRRDRRP